MKITLTSKEAQQIIRDYYSYDSDVQIEIENDDTEQSVYDIVTNAQSQIRSEEVWYENIKTTKGMPDVLMRSIHTKTKITVELNDGARSIGFPYEWNLMWNSFRSDGLFIKKWKYGWH
jgi:hypothetical protein